MPFSPDDNTFYGDTTGVLGDHEVAGSQDLMLQAPVPGFTTERLVGDASELQRFAEGGNDTLTIPMALDQTAIGDAVTMTGHSHGGDDTINVFGNMFSLTMTAGDAETMSGHAVGGNDTIDVTGPGVAVGDALVMKGRSQGGDDQMTGSGPDRGAGPTLYGDAETMSGHAHGGDDTLTGQDGFQAIMYGDANVLTGHAHGGNDMLVAGTHVNAANQYEPFNAMYGDGQELLGQAHAGNDTLVSGAFSDDRMWGDAAVIGPNAVRGDNLFVFAPPNGHDQIMDFQPGRDHIELEGYAGVGGFQDLVSHFQTTAEGTLIAFDPNDDILVRGVSPSQLGAGDFLFT